MHGNVCLFGRDAQRIGLRARFLRGAEDPGNRIATVDEGLEDRLAEILLSYDGNAHPSLVSRFAPGAAAHWFARSKIKRQIENPPPSATCKPCGRERPTTKPQSHKPPHYSSVREFAATGSR